MKVLYLQRQINFLFNVLICYFIMLSCYLIYRLNQDDTKEPLCVLLSKEKAELFCTIHNRINPKTYLLRYTKLDFVQ